MCHGEKDFWKTPVVNNKDNEDRVILFQRGGYIYVYIYTHYLQRNTI